MDRLITSQPADRPGTPVADGVPGALARIRSEIGHLAQTLSAARGSDDLMETVAEAESLKSSVDALVLGGVRELEATGALTPVGWASTQDCRWVLAQRPLRCPGRRHAPHHPAPPRHTSPRRWTGLRLSVL